MEMETVAVLLSPEDKARLESEMKARGFVSRSEFIRTLLFKELKVREAGA